MNNITPIKIHELANIVPMANDEEQNALNMSIAVNGYNSELGNILLYNGEIIDGRCRQIALIEAGEDPMHYAKEVAVKDYKEVIALVKSVNTRRNLTITQKAISAYRMWKGNKELTQELVAETWGLGVRTIKNVSAIEKHIAIIEKSPLHNTLLIYKYKKGTGALIAIPITEVVDALFDGCLIRIHNEMKPTDAVKTIAKNIKDLAETIQFNWLEIDTHEWTADGQISSEKGKKFYYDMVSDEMSIDLKIKILDLVNTIYPNAEHTAIIIPISMKEKVDNLLSTAANIVQIPEVKEIA